MSQNRKSWHGKDHLKGTSYVVYVPMVGRLLTSEFPPYTLNPTPKPYTLNPSYARRQESRGGGERRSARTTAGFRVQGAGFRVQGVGFRVQGAGWTHVGKRVEAVVDEDRRVRPQGARFRVQGSGFRVQGAGCRVQGAGLRVHARRQESRGGGVRRSARTTAGSPPAATPTPAVWPVTRTPKPDGRC